MKQYIVITGGTKGIGRALVQKFAQNGFGVLTCARHQKDLENLKAETETAVPGAFVGVMAADLGKREDVSRFAEFCLQQAPEIEILVNNTGVFLPGQVHNEAEDVLEQTLATNVASAYHLTRALLPGMMQRKRGHVFTMCSTASITAYTNGGSYCISKYALLGFTKVLREEMKPHNIRVTAVLPGATLTASWEGVELPAERFMKPEDIAEIVWCSYQLSKHAVVEEVLLRPQLGDI